MSPRVAPFVDVRTVGMLLQRAGFALPELDDVAQRKTSAEWIKFCRSNKISIGEVATLDDIVASYPTAHHPVAGDYKQVDSGVRFAEAPTSVRRDAPLIGADTEDVLNEVGVTDAEMAELRASGSLWKERTP